MRVLRYGSRAVLVELAGLEQVAGLHTALRHQPLHGVLELVPAARTLLVRFDPGVTGLARLTAELTALAPREAATVEADQVVIPVRYDGVDLAEVARQSGLSPAQVIARHTAAEYRVAFGGFAPGFAYLTGVDPALRMPRRATPRTRVPAGALALADGFTAVYPRESPGGWQLIGSTELTLWDPAADPPSRLTPGTAVRFVETAVPAL